MSDDLIFWGGIPVGCVEGNHIVWFSHAPREAIEAYKQPPRCNHNGDAHD